MLEARDRSRQPLSAHGYSSRMAVAIRERIKDRATPFLEPGETVHHVLAGQSTSPYWSLLSYWILIVRNSYRAIVVTDRRILVFQSSRLATSSLKSVLRALPRSTRIGPASGLWYKTEALGELMYINIRFHKDIEAADAEIGA